ncbi:S-layer homology domain-containing protein [Paenibacillus sp. 32352]|uniref:S-layer homology domain-containing protein n=1 Tax=Paenibacillus sp. 32352 TaxID=1969111 RepID=UPI0009AC854E|nr:S-layer homology domain-containing protein [Paenibacillus sp. 32352]
MVKPSKNRMWSGTRPCRTRCSDSTRAGRLRLSILVGGICLVLAGTSLITEPVLAAAGKASADFHDLDKADAKTRMTVDSWLDKGLIDGAAKDRFGLTDPISRAEFAKFVALSLSLKVDKSLSVSRYTDVRADDPLYGDMLPYIEALREAGVIEGVGEDQFDPAAPVTREQLAVFLIRSSLKQREAETMAAINDETVSDYAKRYVTLAVQLYPFLHADGFFEGHKPITRQMLFPAYEVLTAMHCCTSSNTLPRISKSVQSLEQLENKVSLFTIAFDEFMSMDDALNDDMKYISLHIQNMKGAWTEEEQKQLKQYFETKYKVDVIFYSYEELLDGQRTDETKKRLQGILLNVEKVQSDETGTVVAIDGYKFRSPLGAAGQQLILKKQDSGWEVQERKGFWISQMQKKLYKYTYL